MSFSLDTLTTDNWQELPCPDTHHVIVQVSNASIYIGFGSGGDGRRGTAVYPPRDEILLPSFAGLDRECDAIRIKSYKLATPADVKLTAQGEMVT